MIAGSPDSSPAWPTSIRERTGLGWDAVYDALGKMMMAGWIVAEKRPEGCTPHRVYRLTAAGRVRWEEAVQAEADRVERGSWWRVLLQLLTLGHKGWGGRAPGP